MPDSARVELQGKIALVTGGGTGIGKAIAERFANVGASVIVAGRTASSIESVANAIGGQAIVSDIARETDTRLLFEAIIEQHGRLDIFVNNAGVPGPIRTMAEMDVALWDDCVAINLRGAMLCLKEAARIMTAQRAGAIINMASLMGLHGYPMRAAYCATKFALVGITQALARELGPHGVRVNALCPGAVSGELMDRVIARRAAAEGRPASDIIREHYTDVAALRRWVDTREVAEAALFLASDRSSATTGETLKVDAGRF